MVGFLGMMAAGAGIGLRNASNMNVDAENKMKMMQAEIGMREDSAMRMESLKQKYASMNFDKEIGVKRELAEADRKHDLNKLDKQGEIQSSLVDKKTSAALKLEGIKQGNRVSLQQMRENSAKSLIGSKGIGEEKLSTPELRAASEMVKLGLATDIPDAMNQINRKNITKAYVSGNPMVDRNQLDELINGTNGASKQQELVPRFNIKTMKYENLSE